MADPVGTVREYGGGRIADTAEVLAITGTTGATRRCPYVGAPVTCRPSRPPA